MEDRVEDRGEHRAGGWAGLPCTLGPAVRAELDSLAEEIVAAVRDEVPGLDPDTGDPRGSPVRRGVDLALREFMDRLADPTARADPAADAQRALAREQMRAGHSLGEVQAAYRIGARLAWRRCVQVGRRENLPPAVMYGLAEAVFAFTGELAARSLEGYAEARESADGEQQRSRRHLLDLLLAGGGSQDQVAKLALAAHWPLPTTVAAVALEERAGRPADRTTALADDLLADLERPDPCILVPDPEAKGRLVLADGALRGWTVAVGPPVRPQAAARSLRWARDLLDLARRGVVDGSRVIRSADHLPALLLLREQEVIEAMSARRLAPLAHLRPAQRERLSETLLAWLLSGGGAPEVARRIFVHPQTVRYRMRQLESLFGEQLRDPEVRFELEVVLRARRLLGQAPLPHAREG